MRAPGLRARLAAAALAACVVALAGCGPPPTEPELLIQRYFDDVRKQDFDDVLTLYTAKFYEKTPRDQWRKALLDVRQSFGELQSYKLQRPLPDRTEGPDGSYRATLVYVVTYSQHKAEETITVWKEPQDGPLAILEHSIRYLPGT